MKNLACLFLLALASCQSSHLQIAFNESSLAQRASGVMIKDLSTGKVLFEKNADQYFMPASNMKLAFSDEFDGPALDASKWSTMGEPTAMSFVTVGKSKALRITLIKREDMIQTNGIRSKHEQVNGYFEASIRMNANPGHTGNMSIRGKDDKVVPYILALWEGTGDDYLSPWARYLDDKITAIRPRTKELVTLAIIKLADANPEAAAQELDRTRWKAQLTQEERSWLWGVIGKRAAQRLQDDALTLFARGDVRHMTDDHLEWKARAGLRLGQWAAVRDAIYAMSPAQRAEEGWIYWRARTIETLQEPDAVVAKAQARELYESIASPRGFYEQLALEELGRAISVPHARAIFSTPQPVLVGLPENPNPGSDGATTVLKDAVKVQAGEIVYLKTVLHWDDWSAGGDHQVTWHWFTGDQPRGSASVPVRFGLPPRVLLGSMPATDLGVGRHRVEIYVDGELFDARDFEVVP